MAGRHGPQSGEAVAVAGKGWGSLVKRGALRGGHTKSCRPAAGGVVATAPQDRTATNWASVGRLWNALERRDFPVVGFLQHGDNRALPGEDGSRRMECKSQSHAGQCDTGRDRPKAIRHVPAGTKK